MATGPWASVKVATATVAAVMPWGTVTAVPLAEKAAVWFNRTLTTVLAAATLATARSSLPSRLKSPTPTAVGNGPAGKFTADWNKGRGGEPLVLPRSTLTLAVWKLLSQGRACHLR